MDTSKLKTIIVDVVTGVALLGVVVFGYTTFVEQTSKTEEASQQEEVLTRANEISASLIATSEDLAALEATINQSRAIFNNNAYQNLKNFSQDIPKESVGRQYPFTKTQWKIEAEILEEKTQQKSSTQQTAQAASVQAVASVADNELEEGI